MTNAVSRLLPRLQAAIALGLWRRKYPEVLPAPSTDDFRALGAARAGLVDIQATATHQHLYLLGDRSIAVAAIERSLEQGWLMVVAGVGDVHTIAPTFAGHLHIEMRHA